VPGLADAFERIGHALEHHLPVSHAAGAAIAVTDRDATLGVVVRGFADVASGAPVRPETRFMIGSISKSFAVMIALQEVEAGNLDLHVSVNELLPWLDLPEPFGPITLHHLMSHTSGLAIGTEDAPTGLGTAGRLRDLPPTFAPGERFWYSNDGYKLVGLVLERLTGRPIHGLIRERIFTALEMDSSVAAIEDSIRTDLATGYTPVHSDRPSQLRHPLVPATFTVSNTADGSIVSNVVDMAAYARLLLNRGRGPAGPILSEEMFTLMTTPVIEMPDEHGVSYGYGLDIGEDEHGPWIGHSGGMVGYCALLRVETQTELGAVVLQNGYGSRAGLFGATFDAVRACVRGEPFPDPWTPPAATLIPDAASYAGRFQGDDGSVLRVESDEDGLLVHLGARSGRLERDPLEMPRDRFVVVDAELERFQLSFGRDEHGRVVEAAHGPRWFRKETYTGVEPAAAPEDWRAYPGLYRNDDPWLPTLRVVLRRERLWLSFPVEASDEEGEDELVPLDDGSFAVGETSTPRRIRFDRVIDGLASVATFNGGQWFRSFED
jgi:D-alanyl-D-alanine carboxypeptidase